MFRLFTVLIAVALSVLLYGYWDATRAPRIVSYIVRRAAWTAPPLRIALLSDTHATLPDMPPARLERVCDTVTALNPDIILIAGDFIGRKSARTGPVSPQDATRPFAHCRARLGVFAVLGNHDMRLPELANAVSAGLRAAGVHMLRNTAAHVAGPRDGFWVAGVDDGYYNVPSVQRVLAPVPERAPVLFLAHDPDVFAVVPARVALTLTGAHPRRPGRAVRPCDRAADYAHRLGARAGVRSRRRDGGDERAWCKRRPAAHRRGS